MKIIPAFVVLLLSGCELLGPELQHKIPLQAVEIDSTAEQNAKEPDPFQVLQNTPEDPAGQQTRKPELYLGNGRFFSSSQTQGNNNIQQAGEKNYNLNFDDADLGEVCKVILADILHENYILSPKVSGAVTLQTSRPLSRSELLPTLEMLLQINNAVLTYQDGVYQIQPRAEALGNSAFTAFNAFSNKIPAGFQIRVIPVRNVAAEELAEIIKPLLQDKTILNVNGERNLLLAAGTGNALERIMEMVRSFDIDTLKGRSFGLFPLRNVDAEKIISELEQVFGLQEEQHFIQFIPIERLNAILAITRQPRKLHQIKGWIMRLDRANVTSGGGVNVYRVQHADATKLAETLNSIFSQMNTKSRTASVAAGRKTIQITNKQKNTAKPKQLKNPSLANLGEVKVIADEPNNSLIIVATAQDYAVVQRIIKRLDVMPLQVLIDATIVEVTLSDKLKYGIKWFLQHQNGGDNAASSGGFDLTQAASNLAVGAATGGFGYAFVSNSDDIRAVLEAKASDNKTNVISAPSLMVLNNHEASIQVGKQVPILSSQSTNTSSANSNGTVVTNTIQMRDTGITLNIKPRVNANGLVIMEIDQKADDVLSTTTNGINSPSFQQRQIKSSVAVQSGQTIVLGGLISEKNTHDKNGVPWLYKLPLIGALFGETTKNKERTELVILITPRVVRDRQNARLITNEFQRKLTGIYTEPVDVTVTETP
jgi:general secretion pathway protein D